MRDTPTGRREIVLVHRPKYDDWSFPKGKLDDGETFEEAAVREVEEETGLRCVLEAFVDEVRYRAPSGGMKVVRYWVMRPAGGATADHVPDREVDQVVWVPVEEAKQRVSYDVDRRLLEAL